MLLVVRYPQIPFRLCHLERSTSPFGCSEGRSSFPAGASPVLAVRQPAGLGTAGAARCGCPPACGLSHPLFLFVVKMCFKESCQKCSITMLVSSRLVYSNQVVSVSFRAGEPPDVLRHLLVKVRIPLSGGISRHRRSTLSLTGIRGKLVGLA